MIHAVLLSAVIAASAAPLDETEVARWAVQVAGECRLSDRIVSLILSSPRGADKKLFVLAEEIADSDRTLSLFLDRVERQRRLHGRVNMLDMEALAQIHRMLPGSKEKVVSRFQEAAKELDVSPPPPANPHERRTGQPDHFAQEDPLGPEAPVWNRHNVWYNPKTKSWERFDRKKKKWEPAKTPWWSGWGPD